MDFEYRNTDIEQHKSTIYIPTNSPLYDKVEKMVVNYSALYTDKEERNADIEQRYLKGETLEAIGNHWRLSRERVRQILVKLNVNPQSGGAALMRRLTPKKVYVSKRPVYPDGLRKCHKCDMLDSVENFYKIKRKGNGFTYLHKPCRDKYMKGRYDKKKLERRFM